MLVEKMRGQSILVVASPRGRERFLADPILAELDTLCRLQWADTVTVNPQLDDLQNHILRMTDARFDAVVAFGGGSAIDAAKAIRLATHSQCQSLPLSLLIARPELHPKSNELPLYVLPTTAGTGSEVTPFATIWDYADRKKLSLSGPAIFPTRAFVDPALTDHLPAEVTLSTGLDAINQAAESIWNRNANPISMGFAIKAFELGYAALPELVSGRASPKHRDQMAEASVLSGMAISHTRTALCHSVSYPLTARFGIPHGLACAFTMPVVLRYNMLADDGRFTRWAQQWLGTADLNELVAQFDSLHERLGVRALVKAKIPSLEAVLALERDMHTPEREGNNLRDVKNLTDLLKQAWA